MKRGNYQRSESRKFPAAEWRHESSSKKQGLPER
jgi:hypothetical protein